MLRMYICPGWEPSTAAHEETGFVEGLAQHAKDCELRGKQARGAWPSGSVAGRQSLTKETSTWLASPKLTEVHSTADLGGDSCGRLMWLGGHAPYGRAWRTRALAERLRGGLRYMFRACFMEHRPQNGHPI